jgi:type IV secretory pathway VirB10-like protein
MSDKTKRRLAIAGAAVICIALVVAIGMRFAKESVRPDASSQEPVSSSDVAPEIQNNTEKKEVVVSPQPTPEPESSEMLPPQTDLPEQKLQPDPIKPEVPAKPELPKDVDTTNPSKPPEYKPEDTEKKPAAESKPQGGETKDGKIYVPGFGWIDDIGEGQGSTADDMYENGNKIGDMN